MGSVKLTAGAPRQVITIPAGEPLIITAYYSKQEYTRIWILQTFNKTCS